VPSSVVFGFKKNFRRAVHAVTKKIGHDDRSVPMEALPVLTLRAWPPANTRSAFLHSSPAARRLQQQAGDGDRPRSKATDFPAKNTSFGDRGEIAGPCAARRGVPLEMPARRVVCAIPAPGHRSPRIIRLAGRMSSNAIDCAPHRPVVPSNSLTNGAGLSDHLCHAAILLATFLCKYAYSRHFFTLRSQLRPDLSYES